MGKTDYEIAAEIVQEVIRARGVAISNTGNSSVSATGSLITTYLSDTAVSALYKTILKSVSETR
ncbi:hypothetical protein [Cohnella sp. GCM10012308]|uniref:hypothetical protein n=1 Tax=Cohnella sp. GCM10012308 TaxID=3317329 RepID=UPI003619FCBE